MNSILEKFRNPLYAAIAGFVNWVACWFTDPGMVAVADPVDGWGTGFTIRP